MSEQDMATQTLQHRGCGLSGGIRPTVTPRAPHSCQALWLPRVRKQR
jgi:hypothetical protein